MTVSARTVETNFADALAELLYMLGDSDNIQTRVTEFEDSFPSPIIGAMTTHLDESGAFEGYQANKVAVSFEDGSVLHLTVTQIKESNQP